VSRTNDPDPDPELELGAGLRLRALTEEDAELLVEATSGESGRSLWGAYPSGPYSLEQARSALREWDPRTTSQASYGIVGDGRMLGALGLMFDGPGSAELAYWVRPESRRQGLAVRGIRALTPWAHATLRLPRVWLEIDPENTASLRVAERAGFTYEQRLPNHCRAWHNEDPELDSWHDCLIWTDLVS
jgi:RimJ/RimL family protein N-acetyltransferase